MNFNEEKMSMELVDNTFTTYKVGKRVSGTVVVIKDNGVLVNIGGKSDAFIYNEDLDNKDEIKVDDEVTAIIESIRDENGYVKINQKKATNIALRNEISINLNIGDVIDVECKDTVKAGLVGKYGNMKVFIPHSHIDYAHRNNFDEYKNKTVKCIVIDMNLANRNIVASIRGFLDQERTREEEEFWGVIKEGQIVEGTVEKIMPYGVFVKVGTKTCLLHNADVSYIREKASDKFTEGEVYQFVVLETDRENRKVSLGYKQLGDDPRNELYKKYKMDDIVKGSIIKILPYGAIVRIDDNVTGFLHISEADYGIRNMNDKFKVGQEVEAKIIETDYDKFRISLSIIALSAEYLG